jgi:secreted trypsin-like serine protease
MGSNDPKNMSLVVSIPTSNQNSFIHSKFNPRTLVNDIALIKLPEPVQVTDFIKPIAMQSSAESFENVILTVSGYGLNEKNKLPSLLQFTDVIGISKETCKKTFKGMATDLVLCVFGHPNKNMGSCNGDSGGPLITKTNEPILVGVVSFGLSISCTAGAPSGFTRVFPYLSWINDVINQN